MSANVAIPQEVWIHELTATNAPSTQWLWQGFVARGRLTLLTSAWKAGKTTLLSLLLARRKQGGMLAGLAVQPGKSLVVSEEPMALWAERDRRCDFGGRVCFFPRPFTHVPDAAQWQALVNRILALRDQHGIDLAVIDPLAPYLRNENQPQTIFATLLPLAALTQAGMAVLILHHPAKGPRPVGHSARGSGALLGHVNISIEMRHPGGDAFTRRRRFLSFSRHEETPRQLLLELNPEGTDYLPVPEDADQAFSAAWHIMRMVLEDASCKLTRQQILAQWPADFDRPNPATLWKWLNRWLDAQMIARDGTGRKNDPFQYWLPEREAAWNADPVYQLLEQCRRPRKPTDRLP